MAEKQERVFTAQNLSMNCLTETRFVSYKSNKTLCIYLP